MLNRPSTVLTTSVSASRVAPTVELPSPTTLLRRGRMPTRILIVFCVCLASSSAMAQGSQAIEEARIEVSGGYSYAWGDVQKATGGDTLPKGWNAGFVWFFSEGVGFAVDIAGHY